MSSSPVEEAGGQKDGRTDIRPEEATRHSLETISSHSANKGVRGKKRKEIGDGGATKTRFLFIIVSASYQKNRHSLETISFHSANKGVREKKRKKETAKQKKNFYS
jgi:hypothetical protein